MENRFIIKCNKCLWARPSTGIAADLKDLVEVKKCASCGGPRSFKCPKCGRIAKMTRTKGNAE